MRNNWREVHSLQSTSDPNLVKDGFEDNPSALIKDDGESRPRGIRWGKQLGLEFKVEISKFEGQLNLEEFID